MRYPPNVGQLGPTTVAIAFLAERVREHVLTEGDEQAIHPVGCAAPGDYI